mmetsp:Transcript_27209/g.64634  ORF Transcript_27209/g.64634 Transcript_27209/m.64634 type:complete len:254 (+) Transcript_27209:283-1044(+)
MSLMSTRTFVREVGQGSLCPEGRDKAYLSCVCRCRARRKRANRASQPPVADHQVAMVDQLVRSDSPTARGNGRRVAETPTPSIQAAVHVPRPREATSVATRMGVSPLRNCWRTQSRSCCCLSPWIQRAGKPSNRMERVSWSAERLVSTNTRTLAPPGCSRRCPSSRLSFLGLSASDSTKSTTCLTVLTAWSDTEPIVTLTYSLRKSRAIACTSLGHVAVNINVWRSGRICDTIFLICGSNPMSSMRSASSRTR